MYSLLIQDLGKNNTEFKTSSLTDNEIFVDMSFKKKSETDEISKQDINISDFKN